jgi:putative transposase
MAHSLTNLLYHFVFAPKGRQECFDEALRPKLHAHLGRLLKKDGHIALAINSMLDHVHILAKLRSDQAVSKVMERLKSHSSGWIHRNHPELAGFAWQTGYGAFTVSQSQSPVVRKYIERQEEHHPGDGVQHRDADAMSEEWD